MKASGIFLYCDTAARLHEAIVVPPYKNSTFPKTSPASMGAEMFLLSVIFFVTADGSAPSGKTRKLFPTLPG